MAYAKGDYSGGSPPPIPTYTIAGLFESGALTVQDEAALVEIATIRTGIDRYVSPVKVWVSLTGGGGKREPSGHLDMADVWKRYTAWRKRWNKRVVPASPSMPWGLTVAGLVTQLATEPLTFRDAARMLGWSELSVVNLFIKVVADYGTNDMPYYPRCRTKRSDGKRPHRRKKGKQYARAQA